MVIYGWFLFVFVVVIVALYYGCFGLVSVRWLWVSVVYCLLIDLFVNCRFMLLEV